ncbi:MAG: carboxy terminal-processing peptidase [Gammaproteobacteria bacterium]|nr:carboxy terminal-processing peptidase [Gammaproteobacteria bacterium]
MRVIVKKLVVLPLLLLLFSVQLAQAAVDGEAIVAEKDLQPSRMHRQTAVIVTRVVDRYHFRKVDLDDQMSQEIFKRYLETLDPNKSFFSDKDLAAFADQRTSFDNALKTADLDPAFAIFRLYRQRVEHWTEYATGLLGADLDFSIDEDYRFDRSKAPWAKDDVELADIWRKRVKNDILALRMLGKSEGEIKKELRKRYESLQRRIFQFTADDVFQTFINAYTLSLEPHTSYMSPEVSENFDISMRLSLEGIGAVLRSKNEFTEIVRTVPGGPADESGQLSKGDRIIGIGQGSSGEIESVVGWRLQDVVDKIRGPKGTQVRLEVLPKGAAAGRPPKLIELVRNDIKLEDQAAKKSIVQGLPGMGDSKIGVIEIPAFYRDFQGQSSGDKDFRSTTRDVRSLLNELKTAGVEGVVIDLRNNGGGSLTEATELTGLFIPTGPVVQVLDSNGHLDIEKDQDPEVVYRGPLAVLVNSDSASASEIFAGAIQDYGRGIIIGEPTFGKGTVQTLINLGRFIRSGDEDLGRLRLTMAQFYRISGSSTQFRGVEPDILFPNAGGNKDQGERSLENALPWGKIEPVRNVELIKKQGIEQILPAHRERIKDNHGFQFLDEEHRIVKELRERDTVSLLESKRKAEWRKTEVARRASENRFRRSVGLPLLPDNPDEEHDEDDEEGMKAISQIELKEAAVLLADYIRYQQRPSPTTRAASLIDL